MQRDAMKAYAKELGGSIVAWHDDHNYALDPARLLVAARGELPLAAR